MSDLIDRKAVLQRIREVEKEPDYQHTSEDWCVGLCIAEGIVEETESAEPEHEEFEWCHDCKEYDQDNHCCHRWTKVIRQTVEDLQIRTAKAEYSILDDAMLCGNCGREVHKLFDYCPGCGYRLEWEYGNSGVCYAEPVTAKVSRIEMPNPKNHVYRCENCGQYMHRTSWSWRVNYCSRCGAKIDWSE